MIVDRKTSESQGTPATAGGSFCQTTPPPSSISLHSLPLLDDWRDTKNKREAGENRWWCGFEREKEVMRQRRCRPPYAVAAGGDSGGGASAARVGSGRNSRCGRRQEVMLC
ncbi:hypothetical protein Hdeb2414_s0134g00807941 [Helianthus debilis subsp. tardiflorus]